MRRKWMLALIVLAGAGSTAFATTSVLGGEPSAPDRPAYATVEIRVAPQGAPAARAAPEGSPAALTAPKGPAAARPRSQGSRGSRRSRARARRPRVLYLPGKTTTIDVAQTGPNIDIRLSKCPGRARVIGGGVFPSDPGVFQQGTYIPSRKEFHVLLGFDDSAARSFTLSSHLVCIKGAR